MKALVYLFQLFLAVIATIFGIIFVIIGISIICVMELLIKILEKIKIITVTRREEDYYEK